MKILLILATLLLVSCERRMQNDTEKLEVTRIQEDSDGHYGFKYRYEVGEIHNWGFILYSNTKHELGDLLTIVTSEQEKEQER